MSELDPVMSDADIREKLRDLQGEDVDDVQRAKFARFVHDYQRGPAAEEAVSSIIRALAEEHIEPLVREYVLAEKALGSVGYCQPEWTDVLASTLVERGFSPVDLEGGVWRVGWTGGETITGEQLCRVALLAEWLRKMAGLPGV
jgi:hypothetical protein